MLVGSASHHGMEAHAAKRAKLSRSVRFADASDLEEVFNYDEDESPNTHGVLATPGAAPGDDEADASGAARSGGGLFVSLQTVTTTKKRPLFGVPGQSIAAGAGTGQWGALQRASDAAGAVGGEPEFEFFCDHCDETIEDGEVRFECRVCAGEWCLCTECHALSTAAAAASLGAGRPSSSGGPAPHPHLLSPNSGPQHINVELVSVGRTPQLAH